eukprot:6092039-Alexandrium_andersonii.AAC.1
MGWCLKEALFDKDRALMQKCGSVHLMRDAKDPRLVMRFTVADKDLNFRRGFFGMSKNSGHGAIKLRAAAESIIN